VGEAVSFNPLSSTQWHRVAGLRPRLTSRLRITRQWVRGQRWHLLQDARSGQTCRLNAAAYAVAARLDGRVDLQTLWQQLDGLASRPDGGEPPSQDELLGIVQQLQRHRLLHFDEAPDFGTLATPVEAATAAPRAAQAAADAGALAQPHRNSLFAWRLPVRATPLAGLLFSGTGLLLWGASMLALVVGLVLHGEALQAHATAWMHTPRYLLLATLSYPFIKLWHEAAHALAVRRWGGAVHEAGITLLLLMPVPYVDASAAHGFVHARQRAVVSAAGIMAELMLAAIGLWCWRLVDSGLVHDLGFVLWFVAGISTVLFNANPLQRLDGYHLLTDVLELPNLATRSRRWWQTALERWLHAAPVPQHHVGTPDAAPPAPGERPWLIAYAPLAWACQLALWAGLSWWLGGIAAGLGWAMAGVTVWLSLAKPLWQMLGIAWRALLWSGTGAPGGRAARPRVLRRLACLLGLPLLLCLPWPDASVVQGVVWAPDEGLVRPDVDGLVAAVHQPDGATVQAGDVLLSLHNPRLLAEREHIGAQLAQAEQAEYGQIGLDSAKAGQAGEQVRRWQAQLAHVDAQLAALSVRAHRAGRLVLPQAADLPGRPVHRGELLGHVLVGEPPTVRVAVAETEVSDLREATRAVSVRLPGPGEPAWSALLQRDSIGATRQLPSPALSERTGGDILTEPQDEHHLQALRPVVLMDVRLRAPAAAASPHSDEAVNKRLGQRAWVRFDRGWSPLVWQACRWLHRRAARDVDSAR
jgi:putative peptide zinc metalloprotease protein